MTPAADRPVGGDRARAAGAGGAGAGGARLGLPASGPGSLAPLPRRIGAIAVDWLAAVLVSLTWFDYAGWAVLAVFAATQLLLLPTLGGGFGHVLFGMRLQRETGGYAGFLRPALRTLLLCLVVPAVIWDQDGRGLHDRVAGTVLVLR